MYNVPRRSHSEVVRLFVKKGLLRHTENKPHFVRIFYLEAKFEKCMLIYACFKHP